MKATATGPLNRRIFALEEELEMQALKRAENEIFRTYGHSVSIVEKGKPLDKFGISLNANAGVRTTVALFQGTVVNETFTTTNSIDSVVSSSASDTMAVVIEGHTIDGSGNLTFSVQTATLNGQTPVSLSTPIARATRIYVANSGIFGVYPAAAVGNVAVYDSTVATTAPGGTPSDATATKLMLASGSTQSEKCATATSSVDYWIINEVQASVLSGSPNARIEFDIERRDIVNGGAWRPFGLQLSLSTGELPTQPAPMQNYVIIPPNHDVRMIARSQTNASEVSAAMRGPLAIIT